MTLSTSEKLADAKLKYHQLITGTAAVQIKDGETTVTYNAANAYKLKEYIKELEAISGSGSRRFAFGVIF